MKKFFIKRVLKDLWRIAVIYGLVAVSAQESFALQCFIAKENDQILYKEGECDQRYAPCSTFKIALSLIGFDSGILIDEMHPVWPFKEGYVDFRDAWKQDQTPQSWMKESCVWYSQVLTKQLGMEKLQDYVTKFAYGNEDLSGDKVKNNGLTNAWLSSSLEISGAEQVAFLQKMLAGELPIKPHAVAMTKKILFVEELKNGWMLYGKTGSGVLLSTDRTKKLDLQHGWFIGWIEKGETRIVFSNHISDSKKEETFASLRAKADAKEKMLHIIDQIEIVKRVEKWMGLEKESRLIHENELKGSILKMKIPKGRGTPHPLIILPSSTTTGMY